MIRVGNAQAFWGDSPDAPARLVAQQPDLDFLTLDYLAEVSLSILARQRDQEPSLGYARDFLRVIENLVEHWKAGSRVTVIANAGGLNPRGCAEAVRQVLDAVGLEDLPVGVVTGDDCLHLARETAKKAGMTIFKNLETGESISTIRESLTTANAYLGADPVAKALREGARVVVTGRVADPSLVVAAALASFDWAANDWDKLASATVAGHLIECGTQVTGGIATDWLDIDRPAEIGYPILEIEADGSFIVTKPDATSGRVDLRTVKEQLLYEMGDPGSYLSPDVTVSLLDLELESAGRDRVRVQGAKGKPPTTTYKVSATYRAGYRAAGMLTVFGRHALAKARRSGEVLFERLRRAGFTYEQSLIEVIGSGDVVGQVAGPAFDTDGPEHFPLEAVLRVAVADPNKTAVERFAAELAPLVTSGAQGTTGYAEGRPKPHAVFGFWPALVPRMMLRPQFEILRGK